MLEHHLDTLVNINNFVSHYTECNRRCQLANHTYVRFFYSQGSKHVRSVSSNTSGFSGNNGEISDDALQVSVRKKVTKGNLPV